MYEHAVHSPSTIRANNINSTEYQMVNSSRQHILLESDWTRALRSGVKYGVQDWTNASTS